MKRLLRGIVVIALGGVLLAAGALLLFDANRFRAQIGSRLGEMLGRPIALGQLHVSPWTASIDADEIRIDEDPVFAQEPFLSARSLQAGVRLWPLISRGEVRIVSLRIVHPVVALRQDAQGNWNVSSIGRDRGSAGSTPASAAASQDVKIPIDSLRIEDAEVRIERGSAGTRHYRNVQLQAHDLGKNRPFPFEIEASLEGGGRLGVRGTFGPWLRDDSALLPIDARLRLQEFKPFDAGLTNAGGRLDGIVDAEVHVVSANNRLHSTGTLEARQLQLIAVGTPAAQPLSIDFETGFDFHAREGRIERATIRSNRARLEISGSFDRKQDDLRLDLHVGGRQLPIDDLQPVLSAFGVVVPEKSQLRGGTLDVELDARGPLDALVISGPVALHDVVLAGFSLGSKLGRALSLAGIRTPRDTLIRRADAELSISSAGVSADPLDADIVDLGNLHGYLDMAADRALDGHLRLILDDAVTSGEDSVGLAELLGRAFGRSGERGIGVRVTGSAGKPRFKVDPDALVDLLGAGLSDPSGDSPGSAGDSRSRRERNQDLLEALLRGVLERRHRDSGSDRDETP